MMMFERPWSSTQTDFDVDGVVPGTLPSGGWPVDPTIEEEEDPATRLMTMTVPVAADLMACGGGVDNGDGEEQQQEEEEGELSTGRWERWELDTHDWAAFPQLNADDTAEFGLESPAVDAMNVSCMMDSLASPVCSIDDLVRMSTAAIAPPSCPGAGSALLLKLRECDLPELPTATYTKGSRACQLPPAPTSALSPSLHSLVYSQSYPTTVGAGPVGPASAAISAAPLIPPSPSPEQPVVPETAAFHHQLRPRRRQPRAARGATRTESDDSTGGLEFEAAVPTLEACAAAAQAVGAVGGRGHGGAARTHSRSGSTGSTRSVGSAATDTASVSSEGAESDASSSWSGGESAASSSSFSSSHELGAAAEDDTAASSKRAHLRRRAAKDGSRTRGSKQLKKTSSSRRGGWEINNKALLRDILPEERRALVLDAGKAKSKWRFGGVIAPPAGTSPESLTKQTATSLRLALRKLRNVVSAKNARERKVARLKHLEQENSTLVQANAGLSKRNTSLLAQLDELRAMLRGGSPALMMVAVCCGIGLNPGNEGAGAGAGTGTVGSSSNLTPPGGGGYKGAARFAPHSLFEDFNVNANLGTGTGLTSLHPHAAGSPAGGDGAGAFLWAGAVAAVVVVMVMAMVTLAKKWSTRTVNVVRSGGARDRSASSAVDSLAGVSIGGRHTGGGGGGGGAAASSRPTGATTRARSWMGVDW